MDITPLANADAFCSWSGGKDSCLALYRAIRSGMRPRMLLTMMSETGERSRGHGLATDVLLRQSASLGIPLTMRSASWDDYERVFVDALAELRASGIGHAVFGDIDLEGHLEWTRRVCMTAGMNAVHPLWKADRVSLVDEFLRRGFEATIVAVKDKSLGPEILGRRLTAKLVDEFRELGIDPSGEAGEYHTVVTGGPLFSEPLNLVNKGVVQRDGYWFLDVACL
jgi:uncharacterized protein (TIGR00290 family)